MTTQMIAVSLPDGAVREVPLGTTPLEIANSISPRLAAVSVVARITPVHAGESATEAAASEADAGSDAAMYAAGDAAAPRLVDLTTPLTEDVRLALLTEKDEETLKVVRHSAAHVMATAVLELFPETKLGHGPATDQGFFYDFYREKPFTPDDLAAIEKKMAEGVTFFIIEREHGSRQKLESVIDAFKHRALAIPDDDLRKFVESGAAIAEPTPIEPIKNSRVSRNPKEVAKSKSIGVKARRGG